MANQTSHASVQDLIGWRMRALGLWQAIPGSSAGPGAERVRAIVDHLLALQGQDWNAARWALGVRAPGTVEADVFDAFSQGSIVRSWPMRGTIHVVAAEDLGWMQAATNHRVLAGAPKRREFLGLDDASLERMTDIAIERLRGGHSLSRDELAEAWIAGGIGDPERGLGPWRYHVIWWLSQNGLIVAGPVEQGEPRFRLTNEWITAPRALAGDEALAELATRFARGRGPILDRDLAWWTGLTLTECRAGLQAAASEGRLAQVDVAGRSYWAEPGLLAGPSERPQDAGGGRAAGHRYESMLLPGFDEHLLGYTDRDAVLDPAHFERIVPGRNGMFRPTVVRDGRVVGVWARSSRAARTRIEVEPFPGERINLAHLRDATHAWGAFHGAEVEVVKATSAGAGTRTSAVK